MNGTRIYVIAVTAVVGLGMVVAGGWAWAAPHAFAEFVDFPVHVHFLHDIGAFQLAIGLTLLLALIWRDALATALAGFLVGNTVHAVNHFLDLDLGGQVGDAWALAVASVLLAVALALRLRHLGYVVGAAGVAATEPLAPFVRQKTVRLTTYRRSGTPGATPVSIAVDGARAYVRSFEKSVKTRRLRHNPLVEIAPSTARGRPTGPGIRARARRLSGAEFRHAGHALARKHPLLHGALVPLAHRVLRAKTGRTVHFELVPLAGSAEKDV
jgi:PPOX class probable F420-dependent enzyme